MFSDLSYYDDYGKLVPVPIHYTAKEKFILLIENEPYQPGVDIMDIALPRMGFELKAIHFDSQRMLNPLSKVVDVDDSDDQFMFNRLPYNFDFNLYIGTRKFEDSLKIVEQVLPFFTPELNISIKDKEDFRLITDIPFILTSSDFEIEWASDVSVRRSILWTLNITAKAWLYSNIRAKTRIKQTILEMGNAEFDVVYDTLTAEINPRSAGRQDDYEIDEDAFTGGIFDEVEFNIMHMHTGETLSFELSQDTDYVYWLFFQPMATGETVSIEIVTPTGPETDFRFWYLTGGEMMTIGEWGETPFEQMPYQSEMMAGEEADVDLTIFQNFQPVAYSGESIPPTIFSYHEPMF